MISKEDRGQWPQLSSRTSCSNLDSREARPGHCPVWFPQLHTQKWPWVLPALQPPPGHPGPPQRPVWVRAPLRLHPPCRPEDGEGVGRGDMPRDKTQPLQPTSLRHRQELPRICVQEVGLSRRPQTRGQAEVAENRSVGQRDPALCPQQRSLKRSKDWLCPGQQHLALHIHPEPLRHRDELPRLPVLGVGLSRSPQSCQEGKGKKSAGQQDPAPCPHQQGLGKPKNWPRSGL